MRVSRAVHRETACAVPGYDLAPFFSKIGGNRGSTEECVGIPSFRYRKVCGPPFLDALNGVQAKNFR